MLGKVGTEDLVVAEVHCCPLMGPLPRSLTDTVRAHVRDPTLESSIQRAIGMMLDRMLEVTAPPPNVELVVYIRPDSLDFRLCYGPVRETLVCTLA